MKTKLIATLILSCMTIGLTGCVGQAPETLSEIAEEMARNTVKQNSYVADLDASLDLYMKEKNEFMDFDMNFAIGADMLIKENNGSSYQKGSIEFDLLKLFGEDPVQNIEKYSITNNSSSMVYELQNDGQWTAKLEILEEETVFDQEKMEDTIQEFVKLTKEHDFTYEKTDTKKINDEKVWCYKGSVPLSELLGSETASDAAGDYISIGSDFTEDFDCNVVVELYVYAKSKLPARLMISLPEKVKSFDENGNGFSLDELYLHLEMTEYGKVEEIVVPEEIESKTISYKTWEEQQWNSEDSEWEEDEELWEDEEFLEEDAENNENDTETDSDPDMN